MTAESAIVNKSAAVLAADSAVTITVSGSEKIYNSVNKIFDLTLESPIGVMVYGNLEFMGMPFETIIKMYRRERLKSSFATIEDVSKDFLAYLESCQYVTEADQIKNVGSILQSSYTTLREEVFRRLFSSIGDSSAFLTHLNRILCERADAYIQVARRTRRTLSLAAEQNMFSLYEVTHDEIVGSVFENRVRLYKNTHAKLRELSKLWLARPVMSSLSTGIVIAGFGSSEIFPSLLSFEIDGIIMDKLKSKRINQLNISRNEGAGADIIPFAQKEMVERFLSGVDPDFERYSFGQFRDILMSAGTKLIEEHYADDEGRQEALSDFAKFVRKTISTLRKKTTQFKDEGFRKKVLDMVLFMPKQELANMAESLINLTSLKRRVSAEKETVGGPVDVAVISKDEGFVWIKRKHYFDRDLNPRYFVRLAEKAEKEGANDEEASS